METLVELTFDNDQTIHIKVANSISVPLVGDRIELKDSDGRLIAGKVERRVFKYEDHLCTVSLVISYA